MNHFKQKYTKQDYYLLLIYIFFSTSLKEKKKNKKKNIYIDCYFFLTIKFLFFSVFFF
jgi:hypothetical protein